MRLYLDDDSVRAVLIRQLTTDGHDILIPADAGIAGQEDPTHFMCAIRNARVLLTHNHDDFKLLHDLIMLAGGHHPGILVVRRDNDPTRDMSSKGIVRAIRNLENPASQFLMRFMSSTIGDNCRVGCRRESFMGTPSDSPRTRSSPQTRPSSIVSPGRPA